MSLAACQLDSYATSVEAKVVDCRPFTAPTTAASKDKGKSAAAPSKGGKDKAKATETSPAEAKVDEKLYEVELDQTVLFPEGGGQPSDTGRLGDALVQYVLRASDGKIWHRTNAPLTVGSSVTATVDWARRYDHMQQHTGQHLISAVFRSMFGWNTVSWALATAPNESHVELDAKDATAEQLLAAEAAINDHIRAARSMKVHVFNTVEEASAHPHFRSKPGEVPKALNAPLRVMEIEGVDFNKCCGTHLRNVAELQLVNFCRTEKGRGNTKVFFWTGGRAVAAMQRMVAQQRALTTLLSSGPEMHADKVKALQSDIKSMVKEKKVLLEEAAAAEAERCAKSESKFAIIHRDGGDANYLSNVADAVAIKRPDVLLFLTSSTGDEKEGAFLVAGPADVVAEWAPKLEKVIEGRGGGRKGRYQGKCVRIDQRNAAAALLQPLNA